MSQGEYAAIGCSMGDAKSAPGSEIKTDLGVVCSKGLVYKGGMNSETIMRDRKMERLERCEAKALARYMRDLFDVRAESAWKNAIDRLKKYRAEKERD